MTVEVRNPYDGSLVGGGQRFGSVFVNEVPTWRADQMPYGGTRASGDTKEGPAYAVREMTEERLVVISA